MKGQNRAGFIFRFQGHSQELALVRLGVGCRYTRDGRCQPASDRSWRGSPRPRGASGSSPGRHITRDEVIDTHGRDAKFEALMEHFHRERRVIRVWLREQFESEKRKEEARASRGGSKSIVFTSQPLPEVPADGKDHEPSVRLLQYHREPQS